jgi:D-alanyl-D-alanine carboxypeptidase
VIEAVTGRSVGDELASRLFTPLRLKATEYPTTPRIAGRHARGYLVLERPPAIDVTNISPSLSPASGAIVSNARDVAVFYRALLAGRLLRPDLLQAMKTTLEDPAGDIPGQRHGLGLELFPTRCGTAWGHNGTQPGYFVFAYTSEDGARQTVLMVNMSATSLPPRAVRVFFALIERAYCSTA